MRANSVYNSLFTAAAASPFSLAAVFSRELSRFPLPVPSNRRHPARAVRRTYLPSVTTSPPLKLEKIRDRVVEISDTQRFPSFVGNSSPRKIETISSPHPERNERIIWIFEGGRGRRTAAYQIVSISRARRYFAPTVAKNRVGGRSSSIVVGVFFFLSFFVSLGRVAEPRTV